MYVVFFTLMQALYPTFFVLYPSLEKSRKVRSVQYTNGVRHAPLWLAYGLFDFIFVLIISLGVTGIMGSHMPWLKHIWIMFPILALYGLAAILLGYLISHLMNGSLKTFLSMAGLSALMFMISAFAFAVGFPYISPFPSGSFLLTKEIVGCSKCASGKDGTSRGYHHIRCQPLPTDCQRLQSRYAESEHHACYLSRWKVDVSWIDLCLRWSDSVPVSAGDGPVPPRCVARGRYPHVPP